MMETMVYASREAADRLFERTAHPRASATPATDPVPDGTSLPGHRVLRQAIRRRTFHTIALCCLTTAEKTIQLLMIGGSASSALALLMLKTIAAIALGELCMDLV